MTRLASPRRYLRARVVADRLGITRPTLIRWVKIGRIPAPIQIGPGTSVYDVAEIERRLGVSLSTDSPPPAAPAIACDMRTPQRAIRRKRAREAEEAKRAANAG